MLYPFDRKITQNTRKIISVHIFTSNHFHSSHNTVWALSQQRTPQTELQSDYHRPSSCLTTHTPPISSIAALCRSYQIASVSSIAAPCRSHSTNQAKIDSNTARSRLHRAISPLDLTQSHLSLPSSLNLTKFDEFFFWVLFLLWVYLVGGKMWVWNWVELDYSYFPIWCSGMVNQIFSSLGFSILVAKLDFP